MNICKDRHIDLLIESDSSRPYLYSKFPNEYKEKDDEFEFASIANLINGILKTNYTGKHFITNF